MHIHFAAVPQDNEVVKAKVKAIESNGKHTFVLRLESDWTQIVSVHLTPTQFKELCRDMEVLYMTHVLGVDRDQIERDA